MDTKNSIDKQSPVPLYYQLKEFFRQQITHEYKPGEKFLSEREIARKYSVSRVTASRVMNDLLHENYLIRIQGKGTFINDFKRPKTWNIGYLISPRLITFAEQTHTEADAKQLVVIHDICWKNGYNLVFFMSKDVLSNRKYLDSIVKKVDGLIISGDIDESLIAYLHNLIPVVLLDYYVEGEEYSSVMADNVDGAYKIVSHLLDLGHERIGHIYGPLISPSFRERLAGYRKALLARDIQPEEELVVEGGGIIEDGLRAMNKLLSLENPPTAVFAGNDIMAMGALKSLKERKIKVPEDISIAGFDANVSLYYNDLPLTSVDPNISAMAQAAITMLFDKIENNLTQNKNKKIVVPVKIVYGKSCARNKK
ncbi:MAG: GntR family transcriptional regulator [Bacteroidetes bacterium]|nr:MAG: GntR family transcriptional regulator [Bacteroidota bacterium]